MDDDKPHNVLALRDGSPLPPAVEIVIDGMPTAIALVPELVAELDALERDYLALPPCTPETLEQSDAVVRRIARAAKHLEAGRVDAKAGPWAMCQAIDAAVRTRADKLDRMKREIEGRHAAIRRAQEDARRAAEAERRRAEHEAARAEADRLEAERKLREEERETARRLEELAAATSSPDDAATVGELAREEEQRLASERERVHQLSEAAADRAAEAYTAALQAHPVAALPKTSTVVSTVKVLEIVDPTLVPDVVHGVQVKRIDTKALEKLLRAGIAVPGARLVDRERTGTRA